MELKSKDIIKRKPYLTIMPNHLKDSSLRTCRPEGRYWNSLTQGTARQDDKGWYLPERRINKQ